jgi:hypothetical protein
MQLEPEQTSPSVTTKMQVLARRRRGEFAAADSLEENGFQESQLKDVRQGIASRRRHVAPAPLLC